MLYVLTTLLYSCHGAQGRYNAGCPYERRSNHHRVHRLWDVLLRPTPGRPPRRPTKRWPWTSAKSPRLLGCIHGIHDDGSSTSGQEISDAPPRSLLDPRRQCVGTTAVWSSPLEWSHSDSFKSDALPPSQAQFNTWSINDLQADI